MKQIIIGLGTGRCGTRTLGEGLNKITNVYSTHEAFPKDASWIFNINYAEKLFNHFEEKLNEGFSTVCDVAFYNLNYINYLKQKSEEKQYNIKFICLKRDKEETINSYLKWTNRKDKGFNKNHWSFPFENFTQDPIWDKNYPRFYNTEKEEGIRMFWDLYYGTSGFLESEIDNFKIFETGDLNNENKIKEISKFLELPFSELLQIKGQKRNEFASRSE